MKIEIVNEHDEMLPLIENVARNCEKEFVFINVDSHSDIDMYKGEVTIGNFITRAIGKGCFDKYVWIKNDESNDFDEGRHVFQLWECEPNNPAGNFYECNYETIFYFLTNTYSRLVGRNPKTVQFDVISERNFYKSTLPKMPWLLSIDCDYFSCSNPFEEEAKEIVGRYGEELIKEFDERYDAVEKFEDWTDFLAWLSSKNLLKEFFDVIDVFQPEIKFTDDEILHKMDLLFNFLELNTNPEECIGIFICDSWESGYLAEGKLAFISKHLSRKITEKYGKYL